VDLRHDALDKGPEDNHLVLHARVTLVNKHAALKREGLREVANDAKHDPECFLDMHCRLCFCVLRGIIDLRDSEQPFDDRHGTEAVRESMLLLVKTAPKDQASQEQANVPELVNLAFLLQLLPE
jgi:hypothetical protein